MTEREIDFSEEEPFDPPPEVWEELEEDEEAGDE
jgi:hypothetical protein